MKHEPSSDLLQFLRSKNILPNGYFSLEEPDGTYTFYSVSRSGVLYTLDLEPAALSADDVWEKLDRIQKISREVFEQAQESLWDARRLARGLPPTPPPLFMIRRPPRSTPLYSSAATDVYKRQGKGVSNPTRYLKNKKRKSIDNGVIIGYTR